MNNLVNLFRCMRDRPMEFIRELGFLSLKSRDDFAVLKKFFEKEEFTEDYLKAQLDLTEIMLPEVTAKEVRTLYSAARNDHDLRRAAMFLQRCIRQSSTKRPMRKCRKRSMGATHKRTRTKHRRYSS